MNTQRVAFIAPGDQSGPCGVTDYTFWVAAAAAEAGAEVLILTICRFDSRAYLERTSEVARSRIEAKASTTKARATPEDIRAALEAFSPDIVSLQFSPPVFREGKLIHFYLKKICRELQSFKVYLTVHESWTQVGRPRSARSWILGLFRRAEVLLAWRHLQASKVFASNPLHLAELSRAGLVPLHLPVFSNVPGSSRPQKAMDIHRVIASLIDPPQHLDELPAKPYTALFFARIRSEWDPSPVLACLRHEAENLGRDLLIVSVGETGYSDHGWQRVIHAAGQTPCIRLGQSSSSEITQLLHAADCGISPTPLHYWLKSSACAAMVAHELPLVFTEDSVAREIKLPPHFATVDGLKLKWHQPPPEHVAMPTTPTKIWELMTRPDAKELPPKPTPRPRVGVLVNNFNNGPWLRACIESVLNQTHQADEIIVYDDGSTDDSLDTLRSFGNRIRLIEGIHDDGRTGIESQAHAIFLAFAESTADHLYLLDGDDAFLPDKIARYEKAWTTHPQAVLVQASTCLVDDQGQVQRDGYESLKHPSDGDFLAATYRSQDTDLYYSTSALAFSRSFLSISLPFDLSDKIPLAIDSRLGSIAPLHGPVISLTESLTYWRQHDRSMSRQDDQRTPLAGTLRRHRYFNNYARTLNRRRIHLWLNLRFYRQYARHLLPAWLSDPFASNPAGLRPDS